MKKRKKRRKFKKSILAGIWITGILAVIYIGGSLFFTNHFYSGTTVNGIDYSFMSPEKTKETIINEVKGYQLVIKGRNGLSDTIDGGNIELEYVFDDTLLQIGKKQNGWTWIAAFFQDHEYELSQMTAFNEELLEKEIDELLFFETENRAPPRDAYIESFSKETGQYNLVEEDKGSTLIRESAVRAVTEAVSSVEEVIDLEESNCYEEPFVTKEDKKLKELHALLNQYIAASITYDYVVETETVDREQISEWISFTDREAAIDAEAVREYVNQLASAHDTYGRTKHFTTTDGRQIELPSAYGYKTDRAAETEQLIAEIKKGEQIKREPIYNFRGYVRDENGDIGDNYVEIDLGAQHLYVYQNGEITEESDFVSGNLAKGNSTPAGVYGLTYKERDSTLVGETYESHVDYWMPFNRNIGMHDAGWRKEFGGEIYLRSGSHGCVNLPRDKAENIYGMIEKGMPIICYY